jgi:hypothetical protein
MPRILAQYSERHHWKIRDNSALLPSVTANQIDLSRYTILQPPPPPHYDAVAFSQTTPAFIPPSQ